MQKGIIILNREKKTYQAGFCIIKKELADLSGSLKLLHINEIAYYNELKYDRRKLSYLLGRITAKHAIGELTSAQDLASIFIDFGIFQFPVVKYCTDQNVQVSISHCDNVGITLAFPEDHPLGIDIEKINDKKIDAIKTQLTTKETILVEKLDLPLSAGLTMLWTIKEALSKIFRTGLMIDFKLLEIASVEKAGSLYLTTFINFPQYKTVSCCSGDYVCSVIMPQKTTPDLDEFWKAFKNLSSNSIGQ